ncbi:hypothetical protein [Stutzerimonas stutzeri]|uniref:hypothetical protein n=1 Tax=Stutzerimonas stutzeri TaxID=316 RepID=UPI00265D1A6A|nr:hypothetical protein [Stutzerimonas stutzeri]MCF6783737.1 hypothetical protein [Stutzerimonas stutzeri]
MQPLDFWYDCIGRHIAPDSSPEQSTKPQMETRMKKGTGLNRLGAGISAYYIALPGSSQLIGKFAMDDRPGLCFVNADDVSGEKVIAHWLADHAPLDRPWMIGVIGNASPNETFRISQPPGLCAFAQNNGGFEFNLASVREALKLIADFEWKKDIAPAIHAYEGRLKAVAAGDHSMIEKANDKLEKLLKKSPDLRTVLIGLCKLPIKPNSGEYQILSWYNRER